MPQTHSIRFLWDGTQISTQDEVHVHIERLPSGLSLEIDAPYYGDVAPEQPACSLWGLWNYEVVEIFLVGADGRYLEAEFGPHGHHLLLWLDAPRNIVQKHLPVSFRSSIVEKRWYGSVHIDASILPEKIVKWNLFSIHGQDTHRVYQCMQPLGTAQPDFHQPHRFPLFSEVSSRES